MYQEVPGYGLKELQNYIINVPYKLYIATIPFEIVPLGANTSSNPLKLRGDPISQSCPIAYLIQFKFRL